MNDRGLLAGLALAVAGAIALLYCGYGRLQLFKGIPVDVTEFTATTHTERGAFIGTGFVCN